MSGMILIQQLLSHRLIFLTLNPKIGVPDNECVDNNGNFSISDRIADKLLSVWKKGQKLLNSFWQLWRNEYLSSLRERTQSNFKYVRKATNERQKIGNVVLIKDETPRGCWNIGKITQIRQSRDGEIRSAKVLLASRRILDRPINLLFPIELSRENSLSSDFERNNKDSNGKRECETRSKRKAALSAQTKIQKKKFCDEKTDL